MKSIIIVSVDDVFNQVKSLFKNEIPKSWFDNNEVDEIITRIFNITISSILNTDEYKSSKRHKECYQGNIDYLEYCGLSQNTSFKIVHLTEMMLIRAVFDTYPILDDKKIITIIDYNFINLRDLLIVIKYNNESNYNAAEPINYCSDYKNSGIV
jgi:hypothetical protein